MNSVDGVIYTIGHSTRTIDEFIELLEIYRIEKLIDIRTVPGSKHTPWFNSEVLEERLKERGIKYFHMKELGGFRKQAKNSVNTGWRNASFRGYADYMQTEEFDAALKRLIEISSAERIAIMCAEAVPWRCHRMLVSDALFTKGVTVKHIISRTGIQEHVLTSFGRVDNGRVYYPGE